MQGELSTLTVGAVAIVLTCISLLLFFVVMGLLTLLAIKTGRPEVQVGSETAGNSESECIDGSSNR